MGKIALKKVVPFITVNRHLKRRHPELGAHTCGRISRRILSFLWSALEGRCRRDLSSPRPSTALPETSAKVLFLLGKPEACYNPSRWLSPQRTIPPEINLKEQHPGRGTTSVRPPPGSVAEKIDYRWYRFAQPPARIVQSLRDCSTTG